ncbi:TetR/AcrR family transcriptional regulator [Phycicoccus endophyticus]|uniref:TetR/AcrR family transcriptional regulator n=1 Tax=Phycicoccus endophyticus TaxID=1690220 RepID=A0A7G9QZR2_9MICO|nr:TetR family transcriptional regulator [Phycicoccus endophyticus]NHI20032.1 TetR/AcrR family transcriptional regulator [Phycicoccus endophyticus]QNN48837.1 TetR/AcrR family transcriptional regulator [Phycicoccus endophyticus]GGL42425.1 TetR family transcriptional regulator [Phycicoccus endophyticus]
MTVSEPRAAMVHSAAALLRQDGVRGASFARVIEHSGAPRGSIGHHFPGGKAELMADALAAAGAEVSGALARIRDGGASAADLVRAMCSYFASGLRATDYRSGCPAAAVAMEAHDNPGLRQTASEIVDGWQVVLTDLLEEDGLDHGEARARAQLCIAAVEGALLLARLHRSTEPLEQVGGQLGELLRLGRRSPRPREEHHHKEHEGDEPGAPDGHGEPEPAHP